jgi:hypothetical protein
LKGGSVDTKTIIFNIKPNKVQQAALLFAMKTQSRFMFTKTAKSWFDNQVECFKWGGNLAHPTEADKHAYI